MRKLLLLTLCALLPIGVSAASLVTDANGMKWIQDGSDYYILISETATVTIGGTTYSASDFIPDANFRAFIRTRLSTGSTTRVYKAAKSGYKTFASVTGSQTLVTNNNYTAGLNITANAGITDFTGIGYFHALKVLVIKPQGISGTFNLDVTKNKSLEYLQAIDTEMKELNASGLTSLTWLDLAPSSAEVSPDTKLEIINIENCTNLRGTAMYNGNGTTTVATGTRKNNLLYLTGNENKSRYCHIRKLYAKGCSTLKHIYCYNSLLDYFDVTNCTSLSGIWADHGLLTQDNIFLHGCKNISRFVMKRQQITSADFLVKPSDRNGVERTAEDIAKLFNIQLNGGSYYIGGNFNMYREDADGNPILITNAIREFDLSYLSNTLRSLFVANNLLTKLAIPDDIAQNLREFECDGNLMPTLDLVNMNNKDKSLSTTDSISTINATNQYVLADAEVVKGDAEDGSRDWVAVHYDNNEFVYSMKFPGGLEIYRNRYQSEYDKNNKLRHEQNAWMCTIEETQSGIAAADFEGVLTCPEGSTDRHVFLMSKAELGTKDLDLNGRAVTYRYNTRYNQDVDAETQQPILNADGSFKWKNPTVMTTAAKPISPENSASIEVRLQTQSYILNINPLTKTGSGVDYYSGTLYLDYDALIPAGVKVYLITGVKNTDNVLYENGMKVTEQQFQTHQIGGDDHSNNILPANTPVYVKAETQAGLYAFKPITEYNLRGWSQQRGQNVVNTPNILHGVEPADLTVKAAYEDALADAKEDVENHTNLLSGYMGEKYTTYDEKADSTHKEFYNIEKKTEMTDITPRTILTLSREARTGKIGFWPYGGTTLPAHRCFIWSDDFLKAGGLSQSNNAKGGASFFFDFDEVTGIQVVERKEPKAVADDVWYTLQGVRLSGRPQQRGVYIHNGRKEQIQ